MWPFSKKEGDKDKSILPNLPEEKANLKPVSSKEIPKLPEKPKTEIDKLPSLPESESGKKFGQEMIKQAIKEPGESMQKSKFNSLNPIKAEPMEKPAQNPIKNELPPLRNEPVKPLNTMEHKFETPSSKSFVKKIEPIYVRLDKFKTTVEAFEEIKNKIMEMEEILKRTKEKRIREEEEIEKWGRELHIIKTRINAIDKNIFNSLD